MTKDLSQLLYATYLGGSGAEGLGGIAVDRLGNAYVAGSTQSTDFPLVDPLQPAIAGSYDLFVTKLSPSGASFLFSTFLGGSASDSGAGIAYSAGSVFVTGSTSSTDFPTTPGVFQPGFAGYYDAHVVKIVDNEAPRLDAGGPYAVEEGSSVVVTASGSDPENGPLSYAWDLDGDGTFETSGETATFLATDRDGPAFFTITARVTDEGGLEATSDATVEIRNVAPTAAFAAAPPKLIVGGSVVLSFSNESDPSTADVAAGFTYSYDCNGDGTFEGSGSSASFTCAYAGAGTFAAQGRIEDKDGGSSQYAASVEVLSPRQGIDLLIAKVRALVDRGVLAPWLGRGLVTILEAAARQLDAGRVNAAVGLLRTFEAAVRLLSFLGALPAADAQDLTTCADQVIAALGG
jgi:hypothetical protein